jgi:hypothetical protein
MDLNTLNETPPWNWPMDAGKMLLEILADDQINASLPPPRAMITKSRFSLSRTSRAEITDLSVCSP